jgi:hypothetical protein
MGLQLVGTRLLKVEEFISKKWVMKPIFTTEIKGNSFDSKSAKPQKLQPLKKWDIIPRAPKSFLDMGGWTNRSVLNFLEANYFRKAVYRITETSNVMLSVRTNSNVILEGMLLYGTCLLDN